MKTLVIGSFKFILIMLAVLLLFVVAAMTPVGY